MRSRRRLPVLLLLVLGLSAACGSVGGEPQAPPASVRPPTPASPTSAREPTVTVATRATLEGTVARVGAALANGSTGVLAGGDVGYYMDVQQARLMQLASHGLTTERHDDSLVVTLSRPPIFASGSATLTDDARAELEALTPVLVDYRQTVVSIHGHTDATGSEAANQVLSERRALAVADHLIAQGIERARVVVVGHGSSRPVASNDSEAGRVKNRRIEVHLDPVRR